MDAEPDKILYRRAMGCSAILGHVACSEPSDRGADRHRCYGQRAGCGSRRGRCKVGLCGLFYHIQGRQTLSSASITKAACQRLLRSRRYTRTSPRSIRCVSTRSCRMTCSSPQHYGRVHQQVYGSVYKRRRQILPKMNKPSYCRFTGWRTNLLLASKFVSKKHASR